MSVRAQVDPESLDFRAIALQAPVAWSVIDLQGNQILGNEVYAGLFGYTPEEMTSLRVDDLTHPEDRDATADYLLDLISGAVDRHETDKRYIRKDGSVFVGHLVATVLRDSEGEATALVGVISDVTEARRVADALERSEDRLSKLLTNISDTVTLVGPDGAVRATTGSRTEILGYPRSFWDDKQIFDLVHPDEAEHAAEVAADVLATPGRAIVDEFRVRHRQGHYEDVEVSAVNLLEDPAVEGVVLTTRNITERKASEQEIIEVRDAAVALAAQRAAFVANVSHELRTPLHAVLGLTELLTETGLDEQQRRFVAGIRTEATRLRETVDDLLDFVRVEADGIALDIAPVDIRDLIEGVGRRARLPEYAAGLNVETFVADDVPTTVLLDRHRVDQVLTNLAGNAVKFTEAGTVRVEARTAGDQLVVEVSDTGPGIPDAYRDEIFAPYTQLPGRAAVGGTGLGLALVRGLVQVMEGDISVSDAPGGGALFRVTLPLDPQAREVGPAATHDEGPAWVATASAANVLVVEDNEVNQLLVLQQLDRLGHHHHIVATAGEAISRLERPTHGFDIVLMDWQLPDLDGLEATRRIRRLEHADGRPPVPIVAVTASAMPEDRVACRQAGMDDFLPKPVSMGDLASMIDRWAPKGPADPADRRPLRSEDRIDHTRLDGLIEDLDSREVVESLIDRYLVELELRVAALEGARADGDLEVLHRVGHTLRSTSEMLGAIDLSTVCRALEAADTDTDLGALMSVFSTVAADTEQALRTWILNEVVSG